MKKFFPLILAAALSLFGCARAELSVTFYDVGKADAMLILTPDGQRILIDAGTDKEGKSLAKRFEKEEIDAIDVMIVTHFDKDHVGGADWILENVRVGRVIMPQYDKDSHQYEQFEAALKKSPKTQVDRMQAGETLDVPLTGDVTLYLTAAHKTDYGEDEENDFSLAARLRYGRTRFLFPGDAEEARQLELIEEGDLACDVLKAPHHGRMHDSTAAFLAAASPSILFVSDSDEEPAESSFLALAKQTGAQVYSARDGDLIVKSDGTRVFIQP